MPEQVSSNLFNGPKSGKPNRNQGATTKLHARSPNLKASGKREPYSLQSFSRSLSDGFSRSASFYRITWPERGRGATGFGVEGLG